VVLKKDKERYKSAIDRWNYYLANNLQLMIVCILHTPWLDTVLKMHEEIHG